MPSSPIAPTPYEVLGVDARCSMDELRRAYRRMLRETHPDTGGVAVHFHAVQAAWDTVGTEAGRRAYDAGMSRGSATSSSSSASGSTAYSGWAPGEAPNRRGTRPAPREYGSAGVAERDDYLRLLAEWNPALVSAPYATSTVRAAPAPLRRVLAKALAEEATGYELSNLGIGFTIWHGISTATSAPGEPNEKLDHVVLGASGLYAISSEDWGAPVRLRKGELIGAGIGDAAPVNALTIRARYLSRTCKVPFTAALVVIPDGASDDSVCLLGSMRGIPTVLVQRSRLNDVLRRGLGSAPFRGGAEVFDIRTRLSAGVRFA